MLTAISQINDKIKAFSLGADDFIVKPFYFDELFARVKVFIKRTEKQLEGAGKLEIDNLTIDFDTKKVVRQGIEIPLTAKEFALLTLLCRNKGTVISKQSIMENIWGLSFDTGTNNIEVYISFLRNKIDKPFANKLICTKAGFGYYIKA